MPMNELIRAGLFGRGLIPIDNPVMVERYNACLKDMGLTETALTEFQIDRMGWSPEIAAEMKDNYYLSHGEANPLAIIIVPDQAEAPIYFPMHSFDWELMDSWFISHRAQVADLTRDTGIWLDIDQDVDLYQVPADLTMVKKVVVRVATPTDLILRAEQQEVIVKSWLSEPEAHLDGELITKLEQTARADGDLRRRLLIIRDMQFSNVVDFYSKAFGGAFVLRSLNQEPIILVREPSQVSKKENVFLADVKVLPLLIERGYLETDVEWWQDHLYRLKVVAESFLIDVLDREEPTLEYEKLSKVELKGKVKKYQKQLGEYLALIRAASVLKERKHPKVDEVIQSHLLHPSDFLSATSREVLWQLLTYIRGGRFIPLMYRHQKTFFLESYTKEWNAPKRSWALAKVQQHYDIASKSSGLEL